MPASIVCEDSVAEPCSKEAINQNLCVESLIFQGDQHHAINRGTSPRSLIYSVAPMRALMKTGSARIIDGFEYLVDGELDREDKSDPKVRVGTAE